MEERLSWLGKKHRLSWTNARGIRDGRLAVAGASNVFDFALVPNLSGEGRGRMPPLARAEHMDMVCAKLPRLLEGIGKADDGGSRSPRQPKAFEFRLHLLEAFASMFLGHGMILHGLELG
ncbi:hypothetical protein Trco_007264 [Trichoderma cornu-damae]|uniref:Uncharacterized protein n=1 Tax=Trichoderma cornu-damae TaxID=654480 RepID=A0A9P8TT42_9HYPO|nr:hypothetical protein Trco_007264 [Trichoderma cornu-damae]